MNLKSPEMNVLAMSIKLPVFRKSKLNYAYILKST